MIHNIKQVHVFDTGCGYVMYIPSPGCPNSGWIQIGDQPGIGSWWYTKNQLEAERAAKYFGTIVKKKTCFPI